MESGSWATTLTDNAPAREADWAAFAGAVPGCAGVAPGSSFACLQAANATSAQLLAAVAAADAAAPEQFPFVPVLDGPGGVYPAVGSAVLPTGQWAKIPFITGANKDEGPSTALPRAAGVC
jgi:acetylcholinesterase